MDDRGEAPAGAVLKGARAGRGRVERPSWGQSTADPAEGDEPAPGRAARCLQKGRNVPPCLRSICPGSPALAAAAQRLVERAMAKRIDGMRVIGIGCWAGCRVN